MGRVLVIGCVSFDTIHLKHGENWKTHNTIGGAGLYTALAAAHVGASVTLCAPVILPPTAPVPLQGDTSALGDPEGGRNQNANQESVGATLYFVHQRINWTGVTVNIEDMPGLEIEHCGGGSANLIAARWGKEAYLQPKCLPPIADFDVVHIAALSSAKRQMGFANFIADQRMKTSSQSIVVGARKPLLSIGTYARCIHEDAETVRKLVDMADCFFMNRNEANLLFQALPVTPERDQVIFVTDGANGAHIYTSSRVDQLEPKRAEELDPTGAGDTFCGATLAGIADGEESAVAARAAMELAAREIEHPGPEYFMK